MPTEKDHDAFDLWLAYSHAGSFLERIDGMPPEYLVSLESIANDALTRMMEIKTRILNAKSISK